MDKRIEVIRSRGDKIASSVRLAAALDLSDRIAAQAMRQGGFDFMTARMIGEFEPWGVFVRDVKRALDDGKTCRKAAAIKAPAIPDDIDGDLRPAVAHFAALAGVPVPAAWE